MIAIPRRFGRRIALRLVRYCNAIVAERLALPPGRRVNLSDNRTFPIGTSLTAHVYWIDRPEGDPRRRDTPEVGPAASVFWRKHELLRIDLFDEEPHIHFGLAQMRLYGNPRVYLCEGSVDDRIERAVLELRPNLPWWIRTHPSRKLLRVHLDDAELERAAERLRRELTDLDGRHRS